MNTTETDKWQKQYANLELAELRSFIESKLLNAIYELETELNAAKREIRFLRAYGNKDCTAMADDAMANYETP